MRLCFYREMTQHCRRVGLHWLGWVALGSAQCRPGGTYRFHGGDTTVHGHWGGVAERGSSPRPARLRFLLLGFQLQSIRSVSSSRPSSALAFHLDLTRQASAAEHDQSNTIVNFLGHVLNCLVSCSLNPPL